MFPIARDWAHTVRPPPFSEILDPPIPVWYIHGFYEVDGIFDDIVSRSFSSAYRPTRRRIDPAHCRADQYTTPHHTALPLADRATSYTRRQAVLSTRHWLFSRTGKWRVREGDLNRVDFVDKHVASVVVVRQLQLVVGECHFDGVMSVQHDGDHDGGRLAAIGRGQDEGRGVLTGEVRQLQASTKRRRSTACHERTTSTTQPQNCESSCQHHANFEGTDDKWWFL